MKIPLPYSGISVFILPLQNKELLTHLNQKMRQKIILVLIILLSLVTVLIFIKRSVTSSALEATKEQDTMKTNTTTKIPVVVNKPVQDDDTSKKSWKIYNNKSTGISFNYPVKWKQSEVHTNSVNLKGNTISVLVSFNDSITHSFVSIEYHPSPYGEELFKSYQTEFRNLKLKKQEIKIAETNALETIITKSHDINGNIYTPPLRIFQIVFPGKSGKGEYTIHFETPEPNSDPEIIKFKQLISSIQISTPSTNY